LIVNLSFFLSFLTVTSLCLLIVGVQLTVAYQAQRQTHSLGPLCISDQPVAGTSTWQHKTDRHLCPRCDSNPRSQQARSRRPTS